MKNNCCMKKLTEKDLLYLEDMFNWNMEALKLVNRFMNESEDEEVVEMFEEIFDMHYENMNECISILKGCHQIDDECCCDEKEEGEDYEDE